LRPLAPAAATCGSLRPLAPTCGHLRPLAATRGHSSGCKWLQVAANDANDARDAALEISNPTGWATGHVRPLAATCGYSSGCKSFFFEFPIPHVLRPQWNLAFIVLFSWSFTRSSTFHAQAVTTHRWSEQKCWHMLTHFVKAT
jgi:hypothetical protein